MDPRSHTPGRKVAIVTAAGKGMGAACARELATRGYSLALMSRSEEATDLAREIPRRGWRRTCAYVMASR